MPKKINKINNFLIYNRFGEAIAEVVLTGNCRAMQVTLREGYSFCHPQGRGNLKGFMNKKKEDK